MSGIDLTEAVESGVAALRRDGLVDDDDTGFVLENVYAEGALRIALTAALPHLEQQIRKRVAAEQSNLRPNDERWQTSVAEYRRVGYTDTPDDADRMFWEAGFRQAANAAARIARKDT